MAIKVGDTFGKLTVIAKCDYKKWGRAVWRCKCSCEKGTELDVPACILSRGTKTDCGCTIKVQNDLTGKKFGKLTVVEVSHREKGTGRTYWKCTCDCPDFKEKFEKTGEYFIADQHSLVSGKCNSCGCMRGNKLTTDLVGQVFGTLEVIGHEKNKGWKCKCTNCGKITYHDTTHLVKGIVKGDRCKKY